MSESERWTVKCQDAADGSGDVIVDLPPELLADELTIEVVDGEIVLEPKRSTSPLPELWSTTLHNLNSQLVYSDASFSKAARRDRRLLGRLLPVTTGRFRPHSRYDLNDQKVRQSRAFSHSLDPLRTYSKQTRLLVSSV